jgi:choline dehydrogenase
LYLLTLQVGGGTAGLAIAARLAENNSTTVAVIEGGGTGDEVMERILARECQ